jgi:hypothetical protein
MSECSHNCSTCGENCSSRTQDKKSFLEALAPESSVKKVIGVVSGKGGVGKSLVTSMLAVSMSRRGKHTAILDADITGPSIPMAFGVAHEKAGVSEDGKHLSCAFPYPALCGIPHGHRGGFGICQGEFYHIIRCKSLEIGHKDRIFSERTFCHSRKYSYLCARFNMSQHKVSLN